MATVTNLKPTAKAAPRKTAPRVVRSKKDLARQTMTMGAVASVALTLTGLSLSHLTTGIMQVTGGSATESAAMAVGIDLSFVALEVAQVIKLPESTARVVARYAHPAIVGTMLASAALNAFGFAANATGLMIYPAVALGCAIPALIYALTRVAVALSK